MRLRYGLSVARRECQRIVNAVRDFLRHTLPGVRASEDARARAETILAGLQRTHKAAPFAGRVLIDGTFDNPNYWVRIALIRAGLGLDASRMIGLIGPYRRSYVKRTFQRFGVHKIVDAAAPPRGRAEVQTRAQELAESARIADDLLAWELPFGHDPGILYDAILKRQRGPKVDPKAENFAPLVVEGLERIVRAAEILDQEKPDLVIVSHTVGMICGPLAYLSVARGIPVLLAFGHFGALRFARFRTKEEIFAFYDRPSGEDIDTLPSSQADALASIGRAYLAKRYAGQARDLAATYAFNRAYEVLDRAALCAAFGWNPTKPIVAVYAANWFDWPHQLGMTRFRDFLDWIVATHEIARQSDSMNWLFKPHPVEDWFGGVELAKVLAELPSAPNVRIAEKAWNNADVMDAIDALVTYHGTAGVEFAAKGKPVMLPDRGKYDDCGFAYMSDSRAGYLAALARDWWLGMDLDETRTRAEIFAGWWFCMPDWQGGFVMPDDTGRYENYAKAERLIAEHPGELQREIDTIGAWWSDGTRFYHTWKMRNADGYRLSNV